MRTVTYKGRDYHLLQAVYINGDCYTAVAEDDEGGEYIIAWDFADDFDPHGDEEGDACDWDNPTSVTRID